MIIITVYTDQEHSRAVSTRPLVTSVHMIDSANAQEGGNSQ